jgi:hypothetical protein
LLFEIIPGSILKVFYTALSSFLGLFDGGILPSGCRSLVWLDQKVKFIQIEILYKLSNVFLICRILILLGSTPITFFSTYVGDENYR